MCRFIETIQLKDGCFLNLPYHQERMNRTFIRFFDNSYSFDLQIFLHKQECPLEGRHRCTLTYSKHERQLKIIEYKPKNIKRLRLKNCDDIDYSWKYADRTELNNMLKDIPVDEELIIIKNDLITDTSYANLVFYDGKDWFTPSRPLLQGTKREKLIEEGKIKEREIRVHDLKRFTKCSLINAMLDIGEIELPINRIFS